MHTLHMPKRIAQISRSFSGTDPKAWVVLTVAACTFVAIVAVFFLH